MDRGGWQRQVYEAVKASGVDAEAIYKRLGVSLAQVLAPDYSYPHRSAKRFWELAEEISRDSDVGLHAGLHHPGYRGQVLPYLHQSSATFGEGLRRILAYQRLLSDAQTMRLEHDDDQAYIALVSIVPDIDRLRHASECMAFGFIRYFRDLTEGAFVATRLDFSCAAPVNVAGRAEVFGCPVEYPSAHAEPELFRVHERIAVERMQRIAGQDFIEAVHRQIRALLESGAACAETVGENLGLNEAQLSVRLTQAQTSFVRELDACRCRLAKYLLAHTDEPINEICFLTNFSEPSAFYRAFKRWCDETPMQYRSRRRARLP
jgi:AraC-like DNA-binding protein